MHLMEEFAWYPLCSHLRAPIYCNGINTTSWTGPIPVTHYQEPANVDVVIILNGEQRQNVADMTRTWSRACLKVCVDGGCNFVYDQLGTERGVWPDLITGDFDSIRSSVLSYYKDKGIAVFHTPDQNDTDFLKCLRIVFREIDRRGLEQTTRLVVYGAYGGRLDHVFANLNALMIGSQLSELPIYLLDDHQQTFLLRPGHHVIHIKDPSVVTWCGLTPVIRPVTATTTGLKWNMDSNELAYGGLISTSNKVLSTKVTVSCDGYLLWMMGYSAYHR